MEHEKDPSSLSQNSPEPRGLLGILGFFSYAVWVWLFSRFDSPRQERIKSTHPQSNTNDARKGCQNISAGPVRVVIDSLPPPHPPEQEEGTKEHRRERRERWTLIANWATAIVALGLLVVTARYAYYTYQMWSEMQQQTSIQRKIFTNTQRPLLGIDGRPIITKPIEISGENGKRVERVQTVISVKNFGSQPAMHLGFHSIIFVPGKFTTTEHYFELLNGTANAACRMADLSTVNKKGPYLFPNNTHFELQNSSIQESNEDDLTWEFRIIGCISYWDDASGNIHHTRFCFKSGLDSPTGRIDKITPKDILYACEENQTAD